MSPGMILMILDGKSYKKWMQYFANYIPQNSRVGYFIIAKRPKQLFQ